MHYVPICKPGTQVILNEITNLLVDQLPLHWVCAIAQDQVNPKVGKIVLVG